VDKEDMQAISQLLREKQCLLKTAPKLTLDPIQITIDRQGRVYSSGSGGTQPYTVAMEWCTYTVYAKGIISPLVVVKEDPSWGWRWSLKPILGVLPLPLVSGKGWAATWEAGLGLEPFYWRNLNATLYAGIKTSGVGFGYDLTRNAGVAFTYSLAYDGWRSGLLLGLYARLW
jgi:hypothetical protein